MEIPDFDLPPPEFTIALPREIVHAGGSYVELRLREPSAGETRKAEGHMRSSVNPETRRLYTLSLIESVSDLPRAVVDKLPISIVERADRYFLGFIAPGPKTGES